MSKTQQIRDALAEVEALQQRIRALYLALVSVSESDVAAPLCDARHTLQLMAPAMLARIEELNEDSR